MAVLGTAAPVRDQPTEHAGRWELLGRGHCRADLLPIPLHVAGDCGASTALGAEAWEPLTRRGPDRRLSGLFIGFLF